jgi:hypothetical protein
MIADLCIFIPHSPGSIFPSKKVQLLVHRLVYFHILPINYNTSTVRNWFRNKQVVPSSSVKLSTTYVVCLGFFFKQGLSVNFFRI